MKDGLGRKDVGARPRSHATTRVTEPCLTVVEGAEMADPAALDDVLELLVTWAIRAHHAHQDQSPAADDGASG